MPFSGFELVSHWTLAAPVSAVWTALVRVDGWPGWWPYVRSVHTVREGGADGLGAVRRIRWRTALPYELDLEVEAVEVLRHRRLRGRATGTLRGEGIWLLSEAEGRTHVTYVWRVQLARPWQRWLAPLASPLLAWNHRRVMQAGATGLARHLGTEPARTLVI